MESKQYLKTDRDAWRILAITFIIIIVLLLLLISLFENYEVEEKVVFVDTCDVLEQEQWIIRQYDDRILVYDTHDNLICGVKNKEVGDILFKFGGTA
jgi:hypothetical protein